MSISINFSLTTDNKFTQKQFAAIKKQLFAMSIHQVLSTVNDDKSPINPANGKWGCDGMTFSEIKKNNAEILQSCQSAVQLTHFKDGSIGISTGEVDSLSVNQLVTFICASAVVLEGIEGSLTLLDRYSAYTLNFYWSPDSYYPMVEEHDENGEEIEDSEGKVEQNAENDEDINTVSSDKTALVSAFLQKAAKDHPDFKPAKGKTYGHENAGNGCLFAIGVMKDKIGVEFVSKGKLPARKVLDFVNKTGITSKKLFGKYEIVAGPGHKNPTHIRVDGYIPFKSVDELSDKKLIDATLKVYKEFKKVFGDISSKLKK